MIRAGAADAAWAAADTLHVAARALGSRELRRAADSYDRAARAPLRPDPRRYPRRRPAAGSRPADGADRQSVTGDSTLTAVALIANLVALAVAVAELRQAQQHAAQGGSRACRRQAPARCLARARSRAPRPGQAQAPRRSKASSVAGMARGDFPVPPRPGDPLPAQNGQPSQTSPGLRRHRGQGPVPAQRAGPSR